MICALNRNVLTCPPDFLLSVFLGAQSKTVTYSPIASHVADSYGCRAACCASGARQPESGTIELGVYMLLYAYIMQALALHCRARIFSRRGPLLSAATANFHALRRAFLPGSLAAKCDTLRKHNGLAACRRAKNAVSRRHAFAFLSSLCLHFPADFLIYRQVAPPGLFARHF